jgi:hypothetical protein
MTPPHFDIFVIISPFNRTWPFRWTNLNSLIPRIICTKFDWIWPSGSGKEDFKQFSVYFYSFAIVSPWRWASPSFEQTLIPLPPGQFVISLVKIGQVVLEKKTFKWPHPIFVIISPLKRNWPFIWTILNSLYPRIICTKFDWNWLIGS